MLVIIGKTDYDPENIDNVKYFTEDEMACINFHLLELQDGVELIGQFLSKRYKE